MFIRPLTDSDLPAILAVYQQCEDFLALGPIPTASLDMVAADRALSADQNGQFCGLFGNHSSLMGIFDFIPAGFNHQADCAFIELLMVAAPYRSRGIGAQAVQWLEIELRRANIRLLQAAVQVNNPAALRFWENQGFVRVGPAQVQTDGTVTYPLEKGLQPAD